MEKFRLVAGVALGLTLASCGDGATPTQNEDWTTRYEQAINSPTRLASQKARDAGRKPLQVLQAVGIEPGDVVGEFAPGRGYYSALISQIVGEEGKIYGVGPERIYTRMPNMRGGFLKYLEENPLANVEYTEQNFDEVTFPAPLDAILMVLYYHDTIWTNEDRAKMNTAIFDALKPGGRYLVIDHSGAPGTGPEVTQTLHRMDATPVKEEILAAGFRLAGDYDFLRNSEDPLDTGVFAPEWRGRTDRFVYVFEKPAG